MARKLELLIGEERRQRLERYTVAHAVGAKTIDLKNLDHREELIALAGRPYRATHGVARLEAIVTDLGRGDVDIVRRREVVVVGRAKEAIAVGHHLEDTFGLNDTLTLESILTFRLSLGLGLLLRLLFRRLVMSLLRFLLLLVGLLGGSLLLTLAVLLGLVVFLRAATSLFRRLRLGFLGGFLGVLHFFLDSRSRGCRGSRRNRREKRTARKA